MKSIKQSLTLNGNINEIYDALTNARVFSRLTGQKSSIVAKESGKFSLYDEYISGTNVKLETGKKIVQKWTCADYPKGVFSDLKIEFKKIGERQTEMNFNLENIPDDLYEDIKILVEELYFDPIKDWLYDKLFG